MIQRHSYTIGIRLVSSAESTDEITEELHRNFAEIAPRALNILFYHAENAESESIRLGATRDLLDRAGFRPVDRHEIAKEKSVEELNAQLVSLVEENGGRDANQCFQKQEKYFRPRVNRVNLLNWFSDH